MKTAIPSQVQDALIKTLSDDRTAYWKRLANNDLERGLLLHQRNALIGSLLLIDIQLFEVSLRNTFDKNLRKYYRKDWFDSANLTKEQQKKIVTAKRNAANQWRKEGLSGKPDRGKIIVNLSLGFWVSLFVTRYTRSYLDKVFEGMPTNEALRILNLILDARNKLALHEPVITWDGTKDRKDLASIMNDLDKIFQEICPLTAEWALRHSVVRQLISAKLYSCDQP